MNGLDIKNIGLRDIAVADTLVCGIEPKKGKLIYRGFDIRELARKSTYEETAFILLQGRLPSPSELDGFTKTLASLRTLPDALTRAMKLRPPSALPMDVLHAAVASLSDHDPNQRGFLQRTGLPFDGYPKGAFHTRVCSGLYRLVLRPWHMRIRAA